MPVRGDYRGNVAVHPVSGLKRASGNGQLLHATAEIAGDKLAAVDFGHLEKPPYAYGTGESLHIKNRADNRPPRAVG